jgi:uncharacterized membrane protein
MNGAHWHLVVNHLPIIFPLVGVIVMATGILSKSEAIKRVAFMIFIIGALSAIAAMTTGEGAEEVVERISGDAEQYIEIHEETAETFAILSYILGGISLLGLWVSFMQNRFAKFLAPVTLIFAIVVMIFAKNTGTTGGEIRHTEIRIGSNMPAPEINGTEEEGDD